MNAFVLTAILLSMVMLAGCTDSANELMTQQTSTEPIDALVVVKQKSCGGETEDLYPGQFPPPYRIYAPCSALPYIKVGEERYVIVEFDMEGFPTMPRVVGFQFNPAEVEILNADDIIPDENGEREALYRMGNDDTVAVIFKFLGTTRDSVGWNNLQPNEIDLGLTLRPNDYDESHYWTPIRLKVER